MRICVICKFFPPTKGGTETHTYTLVKYLREKGYQVCVIVQRPSKKELIARGYGVNEIDEMCRDELYLPEIPDVPIYNVCKQGIKGLIEIRRKINEIEKSGRIDVFDVHHLILLPSLLFKKSRVVLSIHMYDMLCSKLGFPTKYIPDYFTLDKRNIGFSLKKCVLKNKCVSLFDYMKWRIVRAYAIRKVDKFIEKHKDRCEVLMRTGVDPSKVVLIPYWIDADRIRRISFSYRTELRRKHSISDNEVVIGFVGRLVPYKNPVLVLEAFKIIANKFPHTKLVFIGDGPLRFELEKKVELYNLHNRVIFLGKLAHEDVLKALGMLDIVVHCQWYSNYGWALLESMAATKAIVVTNIAEDGNLFKDGYNVLIAEPNPEPVAAKLALLIKSPEMIKRLGENAFKTVKELHSLENISLYEQLFESLV